MFFLSKILALVTQPLHWVIVLLLLSLLTLQRTPMAGRRLLWAGLSVLLLMGWQPLPDLLIRELESQYAEIAPGTDLRAYVGVVVLGGATEPGRVAVAHAQPLFNDAGERLTAPVALLQRNPQLRVVYTGGEGDLLGTGPSEAERAKGFFMSMGLPAQRVEYEAVSRTTHENAVLTAQLPGIDIKQPWLLVTSAWHMPRSMGTFIKAGWNVTAYPVDFRTAPSTPWTAYSLKDGARDWQLALHELVGLLAYRLTGRL
jgi:uncharacterized SAM-binding protein YcdF (DUF218 family)